ncbi:hypothetical protein AJ79_04733 [Helicocarpus griseus UAMH5409]|uniref:Oxidation resistance protein 1 n=1 Tax=Helicocarpus griseus UAMH5409 TaxID=1447875 RepID=A0A2B7XRV6_9EURO|nr:hypothetical protein AJ79_04733 [Helicocarpus griseus UAMH5409]
MSSSNSPSYFPSPTRTPPPTTTNSASKPSSRSQSQSQSTSTASYLSYPVTHVVSGLYRRLTEPPTRSASKPPPPNHSYSHNQTSTSSPSATAASPNFNRLSRAASPFQPPPLTPLTLKTPGNPSNILLTCSLAEEIRLLVPPRLQLLDTWQLAYSLDRDGSSLTTLYEKCREVGERSSRAGYVLVVRDAAGEGLGGYGGGNGGGNGGGAVFGAYLTDPPHPATGYYGTGECFLWRASVLPSTPLIQVRTTAEGRMIPTTTMTSTATSGGGDGREGERGEDAGDRRIAGNGGNNNDTDKNNNNNNDLLELAGLPLPPSADTTQLRGRSTTLRGEERDDNHVNTTSFGGGGDGSALSGRSTTSGTSKRGNGDSNAAGGRGELLSPTQRSVSRGSGAASGGAPANRAAGASRSGSGASTPERIRFKAFPYSGVNDYMILCETGFLSVGGGDGHYGLWLDDSFETGVSSPCPTFGNEPLSDEGTKFDVLGVELWYIGS